MLDRTNLLGAVTALLIYLASIGVFTGRLLDRWVLARWFGVLFLLTAFPLVYLLLTAPRFERPPLYYLQVVLMLAALLVIFLLDYVWQVDFRQTRWAVISFVMLFFAGTGGMLGVATQAGQRWTIAAVVLYLIMAVLAFVQRALTGY